MNPLCTVLVTHHLDENRKYLELCLRAVLTNQGIPYEVICLADSESEPKIDPRVRLIYDRSLTDATKKIHRGVELAHPESRFFLFLSDDVVLAQRSLYYLTALAAHNPVIMNPMSNGDFGSRYAVELFLWKHGQRRPIPLHAEYEDMKDWQDELINYRSPFHEYPMLIKQDWVPFCCTLIPKEVWQKVGQLDPKLETRHNDQDYCMRAEVLGIPTVINLAAFAFHFGSKTLSKSLLPGEQDAATEYFRQKWAPG